MLFLPKILKDTIYNGFMAVSAPFLFFKPIFKIYILQEYTIFLILKILIFRIVLQFISPHSALLPYTGFRRYHKPFCPISL